jgi:hypothetical protein
MKLRHLPRSRALWNRRGFDIRSDEILAQVLDRGEVEAWRELYALAKGDPALRSRIHGIVRRVPLPYGHFWLALLANLGEPVDMAERLPEDQGVA